MFKEVDGTPPGVEGQRVSFLYKWVMALDGFSLLPQALVDILLLLGNERASYYLSGIQLQAILTWHSPHQSLTCGSSPFPNCGFSVL